MEGLWYSGKPTERGGFRRRDDKLLRGPDIPASSSSMSQRTITMYLANTENTLANIKAENISPSFEGYRSFYQKPVTSRKKM